MTSDLPDLLRLACAHGMRMNCSHGVRPGHGKGYQANLANSGDGWTVEYDADPLIAMEKALRVRFGSMLERQRRSDPRAADAVHPAHRGDGGGRYTGQPRQIDIEDAIAATMVDVDGLIG